jgi:ParB/RepB/Spo0J family partition protein
MRQPNLTEIRDIPIENLSEDRFFAVSPSWFPLGPLLESVARVGITTPLRVQEQAEGDFRVVSGFRRRLAASQVRLGTLPCIVEAKDQAPQDLFVLALLENLGSRPLHPLEKGVALLKLKEQFGVPESVLVDRYMSLMEPAPSKFLLRQLLELANLPEILQRAFLEGMEASLVLGLSRWKTGEQVRFLELLASFKPGRNRQRELFVLLDEWRATGRASGGVVQLFDEIGVAEAASGESRLAAEQFQMILERVRQIRFPRLVAHEKRHAEIRKALRIPPEIQLHLPRYFEGTHVSVAFNFSSRSELRERLERLREVSEREELDDLLGLL